MYPSDRSLRSKCRRIDPGKSAADARKQQTFEQPATRSRQQRERVVPIPPRTAAIKRPGVQSEPKQIIIRNPCIKLRGVTVKRVKELKLLGLILDENLTWIPHLQAQRVKATRIATRIKNMQGKVWGLRPHFLKTIYKTVVKKIVLYGAAIWALPMTARKLNLLNSIQRPFVLAITKTYRTTATAAAAVLAGLTPLPIAALQEATVSTVMLLRKSASFSGTTSVPSDFENKISQLKVHPASYGLGICAHTSMSQDLRVRDTGGGNTISIFTDGSKINEEAGCAFISHYHDKVLETWKGYIGLNRSIVSRQFALRDPFHPPPIIADIQCLLKENDHDCNIQILWIKAHAGHRGNEDADTLAKEAAKNIGAQDVQIPLPKSYLKRVCRIKSQQQWQEEWYSISQGRRTHDFVMSSSTRVSQDRLISAPFLSRFITGHGPFPQCFYQRVISTTDH
ncbi:uncharacterized protein LOC118198605 [Stegodyphus dumicola]|uniref:uncharacterized protein LOC118198605 n=1 Tax=Stegodyphus dumicola TaxID=202533 RepID=UPI0015AA2D0F|nr:uncharacterized protein LOC118198605 [Stegodyphus dumicola]